MTISDDLRLTLCAWLRANDIDPNTIPSQPRMTLVGDQLTTDVFVCNTAGRVMLDPTTASTNHPKAARATETFTITTPPPTEVASWLQPRCPTCGR